MASESHVSAEKLQGAVDEVKGRNLWDELFKIRDEQRAAQDKAVWLVKGSEIPWEYNAHGKMRWYLHPSLKSRCLNSLNIYIQEIPPGSRSGRVKHPGNAVIRILQGEGYTVMDGQKYHWSKNDVLQVPLRARGTVFQHFNTSAEEPVQLTFVEPNHVHSYGLDRQCGFEQLEACPEFHR